MSNTTNLQRFDEWLREDSATAAITLRQWLEPIEGKDAVIFPPTFAKPERTRDEDWTGYNIDQFSDGTNVCLIDSVGAQANRMEPIFMRDGYKDLVPQVSVQVQNKTVSLLEVGHRIADAAIRFSDLAATINQALKAIRDDGNSQPLARLAPTSIVFGAWDSRDTHVKLPRIVRSTIRAFNVQVLHRSAQYNPALDYMAEGVFETGKDDKKQANALSELGFNHAPAAWTHGGVLARGGIRRDALLNLAALRRFQVPGGAEATMLMRRYLLGISLVALTAPQETALREGGELVADADRPAEWSTVEHSGKRKKTDVPHADARAFAQAAATAFGVGPSKTASFDITKARNEASKSKADRKKKEPKTTEVDTEAIASGNGEPNA